MGWYGGYSSRQEVMAEITKGYISPHDPKQKTECLKHCARGNVVWSVWERTLEDGSKKRWIGCDLLQHYRKDETWMYKSLDESMHPYYYTCPLGYLKVVPVECEDWREGVIEYHAEQKVKRDARKALKKQLTMMEKALH